MSSVICGAELLKTHASKLFCRLLPINIQCVQFDIFSIPVYHAALSVDMMLIAKCLVGLTLHIQFFMFLIMVVSLGQILP